MSTSGDDDYSLEYQWIVHGNIVVPTGNPFEYQKSKNNNNDGEDIEDGNGILVLGPGLEIRLDHVLAVDLQGRIVRFESAESFFFVVPPLSTTKYQQHPDYIRLKDDEFLCPGMIDLHIHASQYSFMGTATDRPLMGNDGWLETYAFPAEQSLGRNLPLAHSVYESVVHKSLRHGTTTAVYFATLDLEPSQLLVDICLEKGQRALVGKVCVDRNAPADHSHSLNQNLQDTRTMIDYIRTHPNQPPSTTSTPLVLPLVTPRFIPTSSPELLKGLGEIANTYDCHITSHISQSPEEVHFSRELDRKDRGAAGGDECNDAGRTDAEIFDSYGLLTDKCIMAHGVFLEDNKDLDLMKERGSAVAHCPLSNFFFAGGILKCRCLMERGNLIGLGTDVAGGYSCSMWSAARNAVIASLALQQQQQQKHSIDYRHAFYLATLGGATALKLDDQIGTFRLGMMMDAVVLSAKSLDIYPTDDLADVFQKLCNLGDDRDVMRVFVQGKQVINNTKV